MTTVLISTDVLASIEPARRPGEIEQDFIDTAVRQLVALRTYQAALPQVKKTWDAYRLARRDDPNLDILQLKIAFDAASRTCAEAWAQVKATEFYQALREPD